MAEPASVSSSSSSSSSDDWSSFVPANPGTRRVWPTWTEGQEEEICEELGSPHCVDSYVKGREGMRGRCQEMGCRPIPLLLGACTWCKRAQAIGKAPACATRKCLDADCGLHVHEHCIAKRWKHHTAPADVVALDTFCWVCSTPGVLTPSV